MRENRWITFDCFGTLVSWQRGFPKIFTRIAGERAEALANAYHEFEAAIEAEPYRPYKEVLKLGTERAAKRVGIELSDDDASALVRHWDEQPVWEDVGPALSETQSLGWKVAALTNCDRDLFEQTKRTLPFAFDLVVTAEDVRSYKPALAHFRRFEELTSVPRSQWVHVACSWFHDIEPASRLGINRVWIDRDRTGEDPRRADWVQDDLSGLATVVERLGAGRG